MVWSKDLAVGYHQQDTSYYCGAATAQMILDSIGAGILDQNTLYNSNHNHNTRPGWYTDPDGLNYTLNHYKPNPPTFNNFFVVFRNDTELAGSQKIVYTLWHYGVATGTLVYGCGHWVVVRGVSTDVEPAPGNTYSINGFWINNPWPPTPMPGPPPPHTDGDVCGTGGTRGIADEYVAYATWKSTYLTGCDVWGVGHNQYVSVCDPSPPKLGNFVMKGPKIYARGNSVIRPRRAVSFALKGRDEHSLFEQESFARAMKDTKPGVPILVQRLDLPDTFYYLIPLMRRGRVTSWLSVDGLYGSFMGAHALPAPVKVGIVNRENVMKRIVDRPVELGENLGRVIIRKHAFCFYPLMVWRPCFESRSPYYPFYMITTGGRTIYVGYDGTIYPELHEMGRGA